MGERTGSRVFQWVWSYVEDIESEEAHGGFVDRIILGYVIVAHVLSTMKFTLCSVFICHRI
ncbi:hypothetical protein CCHR01_15405 [Colletotrichum chrysophilum]|uniref:Uncharacterized protein n=1 Tax=Colletotrichum chrysophilum TaxID=1836956 RepID=A0AAD9E8Q2_9PEZI|nr:hypothetical protein CCHR01_15405 [Colletotrichum chrysophilum]